MPDPIPSGQPRPGPVTRIRQRRSHSHPPIQAITTGLSLGVLDRAISVLRQTSLHTTMTPKDVLDPLRVVDTTDVSPDELHVDGDNPNEQSDKTYGHFTDGLRSGWIGGPIVANTNELPGYDGDPEGLICDGEHRWRAAQEIGLDTVPVRWVDFRDDAERRYWRIHLNEVTGEHDTKREALDIDYILGEGYTEEVDSLIDATGKDLDELLDAIREDTTRQPVYEYDPDHNVYFEDCVEGMRERLDDDSVDCVITDPPYGIAIDGKYGGGTITGDSELDGALNLLDGAAASMVRVMEPTAHAYIHWTGRHVPEAERVLRPHFNDVQLLIWTKNRSNLKAVLENHRYGYNYEAIFYCTLDEPRPLNGKVTDAIDVFEHDIVHHDSLTHPTEKPVSLAEDLLTNSTQPGDTVLDPFMGSGTTAVAAIQNDRNYVGFEIDEENYRDVIERRIGEAKRQKAASVNQEKTLADD